MSTKALMTVEQFAELQTGEAEDYELVDGELISLPNGTPRHNTIRDFVVVQLWNYLKGNPIGRAIGENDCRVTGDTVRRPDVSIFLGERVKQIDPDQTPAPFAPDIAVEVLSQSESAIEVRRKTRDYLSSGAKEVWLLDHANGEVVVHTSAGIRLLQGTDVLDSPLLPGFRASVADLVINI
jgi:Uma2 family endonuclease